MDRNIQTLIKIKLLISKIPPLFNKGGIFFILKPYKIIIDFQFFNHSAASIIGAILSKVSLLLIYGEYFMQS